MKNEPVSHEEGRCCINSICQFRSLAENYSLIRLHGKSPIEKGWQQYCQTKRPLDEIGFEQGDNAGIACGRASGVIVLDIDDEEAFKRACQKHGWNIPSTRIVRTGSGRRHYYFQYPIDGKHYGNRSKRDYGFDIRGVGGQVVAPGSKHPVTGGLYEFENDLPVASAPDWLLELSFENSHRQPVQRIQRTIEEDIDVEKVDLESLQIPPNIRTLIMEGKPKGERSEAIMKVLVGLLSNGVSDEQIFGLFEEFPIGEKYLEKGASRFSWLQPQIGKAREYLARSPFQAPELKDATDLLESCSGEGVIDAGEFTDRMEKHWTGTLGNVSSPALRNVWSQLAEAFNFNIQSHNLPQMATRWIVAQPPTGSGKTQSAIVYCCMLSTKFEAWEHPGVLIVTRLKAEADSIANQINELSGKAVAVSCHTDSTSKLEDLKDWPVVVITHRAYELALDYLGQDGSIQQTWRFFHDYHINNRKLVIIDECLDIVETSQIGIEELKQTLAAIPIGVRERFQTEVKAIQTVINLLDGIDEKASQNGDKSRERMLEPLDLPDLTLLRKALKDIRFDYQIHKNDLMESSRLREIHDRRLKSLHAIFKSWVYYSRTKSIHTLNTARLIVPEDVKGAVVLDATASSNIIYELFEHAFVLSPPEGSRSYRNVTVHVSKGHKVGKVHMERNGKELCGELIGDLNGKVSGKDVFIVTHKHLEPLLAPFEPQFKMHIGHWGAVDGSNAWRDCDTAVIFGLPYRPDTWSANVFMAFQGPQSDEWLQSHGKRPFGEHPDIRKSLRIGQMVTDVVQAINRIRCRRVIDIAGNCPQSDVYIMVPNDDVGNALMDGIRLEMPGVQILEDWVYEGQKTSVKKSRWTESLIKYFETMELGRVSKAQLREIFGMSSSTIERLVSEVRRAGSDLSEAMTANGVRMESSGNGRGNRIYFVKE